MGDNIDLYKEFPNIFKRTGSFNTNKMFPQTMKQGVSSGLLNSYSNVTKAAQADIDNSPVDEYIPSNTENKLTESTAKVGNFMGSTAGNLLSNGIGLLSSGAQKLFNPGYNADGENTGQQNAEDAITSMVSMIPGYGQAIAAAMKLSSGIQKATDTQIDSMSKEKADAIGLGGFGRFANNALGVLGNLGGLSWINKAVQGEVADANMSRETKELSDAFGDTVGDINTAQGMGGKNYMIGKNKADSFVSQQNRNNDLLTQLGMTNTFRKQSSYGQDLANQNQNIYMGRSMASDRAYVGKQGMKLMDKKSAANLLKSYKSGGKYEKANLLALAQLLQSYLTGNPSNELAGETVLNENAFSQDGKYDKEEEARDMVNRAMPVDKEIPYVVAQLEEEINSLPGGKEISSNIMQGLTPENAKALLDIISGVQQFKNGGSMMIPDGALHKELHHMEDVNPDMAEELTKKGIPVVITDKEGNIDQCAEVEKEEITISKSLTDQIEELKKDGSEEAMIKAGKLIVKVMFTDCEDNAGLIDRVE